MMPLSSPPSQLSNPNKHVLLSTGATAPFPRLLHRILSPECLLALSEEGYTNLTLQIGETLSEYEALLPQKSERNGIEIRAFDFKAEGLHAEMRECQAGRSGKEKERGRGLVICHAGAGTILDAMRLDLPLIVVPNTGLLDNHQKELADELHRQKYAIASTIEDLPNAIRTATTRARQPWKRPDVKRPNFAQVIDETVGYEEAVKSRLD